MDKLVLLAKSAVETFAQEQKIIVPPANFPKEYLDQKSGTFVTIEKNERLRGCIGTYLPMYLNVAEEIINNAIAAASEDCRFGPVKKEELPDLTYMVYILGEPETIKDISELNPKKFGVIVKTAGNSQQKCGLLLPDLNGVDTIEEQISIACRKGGINPEKDEIIIYKFTAKKYQ